MTNGLAAGLPLAAAIKSATNRWMGWTISRRTERETGIPHDLLYLTGFVTCFEIEAEMAAA